jgi:hypothetical protein
LKAANWRDVDPFGGAKPRHLCRGAEGLTKKKKANLEHKEDTPWDLPLQKFLKEGIC